MNENNAAQPGLTDEEILLTMRVYLNYGDGGYVCDTAPETVIAAGRALLSKLRAPVADERAAFEADHLRRFKKPGLLGWEKVGMFAGTFGHALTRARWEGWQARAALASAPVAREAQPVAWRYRRDSAKEEKWMSGQDPASAEWFYRDHTPKTTELREGAFQLSPARDCVDWEPLYAAPQASEAVRDAAFEAVRKRLCKLPRYSFFAGAALGSVRRVEDRSGNWIEFDAAHALFDPVSVDAALSAQPGAQRTGGSE